MWVIRWGLTWPHICTDQISSDLYKHIFLLNINHMFLMFKHSQRLNDLLANLIHPDENVYLSLRNISEIIMDIFWMLFIEKWLWFSLMWRKPLKILNGYSYLWRRWNFITWIQIIYNGQEAKIMANGFISQIVS